MQLRASSAFSLTSYRTLPNKQCVSSFASQEIYDLVLNSFLTVLGGDKDSFDLGHVEKWVSEQDLSNPQGKLRVLVN